MPRYILIERASEGGGILGDTKYCQWSGKPVPNDPKLTPIKAACMLQDRGRTDQYPYRYRSVARGDPKAVFDVYRPAPDYGRAANAEAVGRDCTYVASVARIYPTCCICKVPMDPMEHGVEMLWLYGHDAQPVREGRCCTNCNNTRVIPARAKAERDEMEAFCQRYPKHRPGGDA